MAEAFFGYLLPWGQMSFWGAQVIVNLFSAIPVIGNRTCRSGCAATTCRRRDAEPLLRLPRHRAAAGADRAGGAHIIALHEVGSNNPDGVEIKKKKDAERHPARRHSLPPVLHGEGHRRRRGLPDGLLGRRVLHARGFGGYFLEYNNFIPADPLKTPPHIAPVWYFTPYYSMLRAVTYPALRHRCQVLGRGGHGRRHPDLRLPALAGPQPGEVDPLIGDHVISRMTAEMGVAAFGKAPPDLSVMARAKRGRGGLDLHLPEVVLRRRKRVPCGWNNTLCCRARACRTCCGSCRVLQQRRCMTTMTASRRMCPSSKWRPHRPAQRRMRRHSTRLGARHHGLPGSTPAEPAALQRESDGVVGDPVPGRLHPCWPGC
jgi:hypothetical protein